MSSPVERDIVLSVSTQRHAGRVDRLDAPIALRSVQMLGGGSAQRSPVRVAIDVPEEVILRAGMTATVAAVKADYSKTVKPSLW
jgi:hypothetical protein